MKVMLISDQPSRQNPVPARARIRAGRRGWTEGFLAGGCGGGGNGEGSEYLGER